MHIQFLLANEKIRIFLATRVTRDGKCNRVPLVMRMVLLGIRKICHFNGEIFGGKSYVARQTRDVAKEATFKHLIQTGLHTGRKRIPSGVLILFSEYKLYSTYSVIFKLE